jgi:WD40 repeat protein
MAWSPDGQRLAIALARGGLLVLDPAGEELARLDETGAVKSLAWSPDGSKLAVRTGKGALVWDGRSASCERLKGLVGSLAWSPAGAPLSWSPAGAPRREALLAVAHGSEVRLCDERLRPRAILSGHTRAIWTLAWTADGATLLSGGRDGTARAWDARRALASPDELVELARERGGRVADVLETEPAPESD